MSDLQNQTPANTYKGLLQVGDYINGVDSTAKYVSDGESTDSALAISTTAVGIGTDDPDFKLTVDNGVGNEGLKVIAGNNGDANESVLEAWNNKINGSSPELLFKVRGDGNCGIGTTSPDRPLHIFSSTTDSVALRLTNQSDTSYYADIANGFIKGYGSSTSFKIILNDDEKMRINSDGRCGIGTTSPSAELHVNNDSTSSTIRLTSSSTQNNDDGAFIRLDSSGDFILNNKDSGVTKFQKQGDDVMIIDPNGHGNVTPGTDDAQDFGSSSKRWDDIYATNTTIQSSDRELKQDIEELSEAETRVAQACKGLLRKYRWKDQVAAKGDEARIHFGIIAQDLEDAFTAEGLDAGRYGMFVKNTWWTADRVIPAVEAVEAVEAVYDEEGNEVSPAVQAVEAQPERTVTEIFENSEDAPEGATEVTQRGVRYAELLAFIIAAI